MSYHVGDKILIRGGREGTVHYVGPLENKNGTFYGIEMMNGNGKHNGIFEGKKYFVCPQGKGLFLNKSQIVCHADDVLKDEKLKEDELKNKLKSKETNTPTTDDVKIEHSQDSGKKNANRKTGPKEEHTQTKSTWKPPEWTKDYTSQDDTDSGFLAERYTSMYGKKYELKGLYGSRGHPGFKKFRNTHYTKWTEEDWKAWQEHLNEENSMIEKERKRISQERDDIAKLNKNLNDKARKEVEKRQKSLVEEEARLKQLELDRQKEADELEKEKKRIREEAEELERKYKAAEEAKKIENAKDEQRRKQLKEETDALEEEKKN